MSRISRDKNRNDFWNRILTRITNIVKDKRELLLEGEQGWLYKNTPLFKAYENLLDSNLVTSTDSSITGDNIDVFFPGIELKWQKRMLYRYIEVSPDQIKHDIESEKSCGYWLGTPTFVNFIAKLTSIKPGFTMSDITDIFSDDIFITLNTFAIENDTFYPLNDYENVKDGISNKLTNKDVNMDIVDDFRREWEKQMRMLWFLRVCYFIITISEKSKFEMIEQYSDASMPLIKQIVMKEINKESLTPGEKIVSDKFKEKSYIRIIDPLSETWRVRMIFNSTDIKSNTREKANLSIKAYYRSIPLLVNPYIWYRCLISIIEAPLSPHIKANVEFQGLETMILSNSQKTIKDKSKYNDDPSMINSFKSWMIMNNKQEFNELLLFDFIDFYTKSSKWEPAPYRLNGDIKELNKIGELNSIVNIIKTTKNVSINTNDLIVILRDIQDTRKNNIDILFGSSISSLPSVQSLIEKLGLEEDEDIQSFVMLLESIMLDANGGDDDDKPKTDVTTKKKGKKTTRGRSRSKSRKRKSSTRSRSKSK